MRYEYGVQTDSEPRMVSRHLSLAYARELAASIDAPSTIYRRPRFNGTMDWNTWMIGAEKVEEWSLFEAEYTDTYGGEANYCWVRRELFTAVNTASDRALMRKAKALMMLSGVRGRRRDIGEMMEFRPYGCCTVLFVTYQDL